MEKQEIYNIDAQQPCTVPSPTDKEKENYNYILIYRRWQPGIKFVDDTAVQYYDWVTKITGFKNFDDLIKWLNSSNDENSVIINEDELIAIYDLTKAEKIDVKLTVEEKKLINYEWKKINLNKGNKMDHKEIESFLKKCVEDELSIAEEFGGDDESEKLKNLDEYAYSIAAKELKKMIDAYQNGNEVFSVCVEIPHLDNEAYKYAIYFVNNGRVELLNLWNFGEIYLNAETGWKFKSNTRGVNRVGDAMKGIEKLIKQLTGKEIFIKCLN